MPQVDWAVNQNNYGVLIMNPCHKDDDDAPFEDMSEHARYVWENYVLDSGFETIYIIAFAAGADCLISIQ